MLCLLSRKHINDIARRCDSQPETLFVFFGETGSGKSLLINAVLDQRNLLRTSNIGACTAVPFHVCAAGDGSNMYTADIDFMSETEWEQELKLLLEDLLMREASDDFTRQPDSSTNPVAAAAWEKFKVVYGRVPTDSDDVATIREGTKDNKYLGRAIPFESQTVNHPHMSLYCAAFIVTWCVLILQAKGLQSEIVQYLMSSSSATTDGRGQLWPMVKQIRQRVPGSSLLQQGAVLVDLPGTGDSNSARDGVAKKVSCMLVLFHGVT